MPGSIIDFVSISVTVSKGTFFAIVIGRELYRFICISEKTAMTLSIVSSSTMMQGT